MYERDAMHTNFHQRIQGLNDGAYAVFFHKKRYLLRKQTLLKGQLIKLYAEELGGNNFVSLNYYPEIKNGLIKPCEMPVQKVVDFILQLKLFSENPEI